jgi:hypothetical protein
MLLSQVGEHDLIGTIELPLEDWDAGGPEEEDFLILSEPEMVRAMRSGEEDHMVPPPPPPPVLSGHAASLNPY